MNFNTLISGFLWNIENKDVIIIWVLRFISHSQNKWHTMSTMTNCPVVWATWRKSYLLTWDIQTGTIIKTRNNFYDQIKQKISIICQWWQTWKQWDQFLNRHQSSISKCPTFPRNPCWDLIGWAASRVIGGCRSVWSEPGPLLTNRAQNVFVWEEAKDKFFPGLSQSATEQGSMLEVSLWTFSVNRKCLCCREILLIHTGSYWSTVVKNKLWCII